jgi:hypothetical protein
MDEKEVEYVLNRHIFKRTTIGKIKYGFVKRVYDYTSIMSIVKAITSQKH